MIRVPTMVEPFQRLFTLSGKLLKQLDPEAASFHRAKATVLIRVFAGGAAKYPGYAYCLGGAGVGAAATHSLKE